MKLRILACTTTLALVAGVPFALAQSPVAPAIVSPAIIHSQAAPAAPGRYTGPSSATVSSVKNLLENGRDDQFMRLQGRIVSHDGGENYTFADDSGRMTVEISARYFPPNQSVSAEQRVELAGEIDKGFRKTTLDVKDMRLLP